LSPPPEEPAAGEAPPPDGKEIDALRAEYLQLRDRLFRSRARAAAVASELYSTRLTVNLDYDARYYRVRRATIRLDGANIFDDSAGVIASDHAPRFAGFVAPGDHVVNIRIEAVANSDEVFTSIIDNTFTIRAPNDADLTINAKAGDRGDLGERWASKRRGSYQLHLDVGVDSAFKAGKAKSGKSGGAK
jgi:hypothetical protein